ncbi:MAG: hypothetical protein O2801_08450 [Actinomycetota bacterium]|nr:hypothetical protein [Actinomycetota bacterium]MDA3012555.1 hypothetical protein [Actinomycetota bacterium]
MSSRSFPIIASALLAGITGGFIGAMGATDPAPVDANRGNMNQYVPMLNSQDISARDTNGVADLATTSISPERIVDTRAGAFALGGTKEPWSTGETRTVQAGGLGSIPDDAAGVVVNITALNATEEGTFLTVFPSGESRPEASTLNPTQGSIAFNAATVLLNDGAFDVYNYIGDLDVIIDVTAYLTRDLSESVARLQTGEPLLPLKGIAGVTFALDTSYYSDWHNYQYSDPAGRFGAPVPEGRYSESAEVEFTAAVQDITRAGFELCLRIESSTEGGLDDSTVCVDESTPAEDGYLWITSSRVPLPQSGVISLSAKAARTDGSCGTTFGTQCTAILEYFGFRVFDSAD